MDEDNALPGFILGVVIAAAAVFFLMRDPNGNMIEKCKQDRNVYECQIQAVPVAPASAFQPPARP